MVNYTMDSRDQLLSHQVEIVHSLADFFDTVKVITSNSPSNFVEGNISVKNLGWKSHGRLRNLLCFTYHFFKAIISERPSVVFFHMTDFQAFLAGPVLKILRIKSVLWYAHKKRSKFLTIAEYFIEEIISSTVGSYPPTRRKVNFIGQSINSSNFPYREKETYEFSNLIHIGRLDPSKRIDYIIDQVNVLREGGLDLNLNFVGSTGRNRIANWVEYLREKSEIFSWIHFIEGVPREDVPRFLQSSDVFIHAYLGSLDKTLIEATFTGLPVVTENLEYTNIFGTWSNLDNPNLEKEMQALVLLPAIELVKELRRRYEIAYTYHSLNQWVDKLVKILKS